MALTAAYRWLSCQELIWQSEDSGASFYDTLKALARSRITKTAAGRTLVSTSVNGKSFSYALPSRDSGVTETELVELSADLLRGYAAARARLISAGTEEPTDAEISAELLGSIEAVTEIRTDFSDLRR